MLLNNSRFKIRVVAFGVSHICYIGVSTEGCSPMATFHTESSPCTTAVIRSVCSWNIHLSHLSHGENCHSICLLQSGKNSKWIHNPAKGDSKRQQSTEYRPHAQKYALLRVTDRWISRRLYVGWRWRAEGGMLSEKTCDRASYAWY